MSFLEAGTKYLRTIESYDKLSEIGKVEAKHLLIAYEEIMKTYSKKLCALDLDILLRLTESGQAICMKDTELADTIFRKAIELSNYNKLVLRHYSEFLNIHGWDLESIQLKKYVKQNQLREAQTFASKLVTFEYGKPVNLSHDPGALTLFAKGEFSSVFAHVANRYLAYINDKLNNNKRILKDEVAWLNSKMKLFIPCIEKEDLDILHEFTEKGLAKYIPTYEIAFMLYKKNLELEPNNHKVTAKFYKLLTNVTAKQIKI